MFPKAILIKYSFVDLELIYFLVAIIGLRKVFYLLFLVSETL